MRWAPIFGLALLAGASASAGDRSADAVSYCEDPGCGGRVAWFSGPTNRYGHAVLGDTPEWGDLVYQDPAMGTRVFNLAQNRVFEDIAPRLADLDGDGVPEVVVVESDMSSGARLSVYAQDGEVLALKAAAPFIGRRNRWLAPAGIADLDGDGTVEIAYVEKPHIGGVLRIWSWRAGNLQEIAFAPGFSNHRIGQDFITGGVRDCGSGPELVLPDFRWSGLLAVRLEGATIQREVVSDMTDRQTVNRALACEALE